MRITMDTTRRKLYNIHASLNCEPSSLCNYTSGVCVASETIECSTTSGTPCLNDYQYCDCSSGVGNKGVCRRRQSHPLFACESQYVALYECLRSKCNEYPNAPFPAPVYYPFDGFSC